MKHIKSFDIFLNESQSKKIKKYFTFSVVLEWYRKNKEMIAKLLGCSVADLASEDTLMEQSYGLVNHVINTQTRGNEGRDGIEIAGFSEFNKLEKNLIHDILHNMYQVQSKQFSKSLSDIQYTESEIFEEIEILGIEESFMKFMNIKYPKTDFINQNINLLASYLMMSILKYDPLRIEKILDNKVEPYLEIYGKKYPVKDTPYENFFELFKNKQADYSFKIKNASDFRYYMINLINVATGISYSGGDRASYPDGEYYGNKSYDDLSDNEKEYYIQSLDSNYYKHLSENDLTIDILDEKEIAYKIIDDDDDDDFGFYNPNELELFPNKKPKNKLRHKLLKTIPIKAEFVDDDGNIDGGEWFSFLKKIYKVKFYNLDDNEYLGLRYNDGFYLILDETEFHKYVSESFQDGDGNASQFDNDEDFINRDDYENRSFENITRDIFRYDDSIAIMRRNFRTNDIIKNNTKIGNLYSMWGGWKQEEIKTKNPNDKYTDFVKSDLSSNKSISKQILTDNGKRLIDLLNNLRGYVINNIENIKLNYKEISKKFNSEDIEKYRSINLEELQRLLDIVSTINIEDGNLLIKLTFVYGYASSRQNVLEYSFNNKVESIMNFYTNFQLIKDFKNKIKTYEDGEFLMNYVNEKGLLRTSADFLKFKKFVSNIAKYESVLNNKPYKEQLLIISKSNINIDDETIKKIKSITEFQSIMKNNKSITATKKILNEFLQKNLPSLKYKDLTILNDDSYDIECSILI